MAPNYSEILNFIETNGIRDKSGGYTIFEDRTLSRMMGVLIALREQAGKCFPGRKPFVRYRPKHDTPEHHAEACWRLSRPNRDENTRHFPAEAMRHLRLAGGQPVRNAPNQTPPTSIPGPVLKALQRLEYESNGQAPVSSLAQLGYTSDVLAYCETNRLLEFSTFELEDPGNGDLVTIYYWHHRRVPDPDPKTYRPVLRVAPHIPTRQRAEDLNPADHPCARLSTIARQELVEFRLATDDGTGGVMPTRRKSKSPAWAQLVLYRSTDGSDHIAEFDGKRIRIRGDAAYDMLDALQKKKGDRIKAAALQKLIHQRPDRVAKLLDKKLQRIIDPPGRGIGYAML